MSNEDKVIKAIEYLRWRGKYIADVNCKWEPRNAASTDVRLTWEEYRASLRGLGIVRRLSR